jgi:pimeloyl-[acyl-carrier protein] methyl ester esterase
MHRWLWINGWGMDDWIWDGIRDEFGHHSFVSYTACTEASHFLRAVQKELQSYPDDHFTLVGWSMGGLLALQAALEGKSAGSRQIQRLVLISSTSAFCDPVSGWSPRIVRRMKQALAADSSQVIGSFIEKMFSAIEVEHGMLERFTHLYGADQGGEDPDVVALGGGPGGLTDTRTTGPRDVKTLEAGLEYLIETRLTELIAEVAQPTLIIHGEQDSICPIGAAREMAARIRHAKLVIMPSSGHIPFYTESERFFTELRIFHHETNVE